MPMPVFQEYEPAGDCVCLGCVQRRRALARARAIPLRDGGHPAARGARRALVLATAAGVVLGGGSSAVLAATPRPPVPGPVKLDDPGSPQGDRAPLHGPKAKPVGAPGAPAAPGALKRLDRTTIINRAKLWLEAEVPYSMSEYWSDGYRQDCSGYVSMVWNLGTNEWTGSLDKFATKITKEELLPGDMLLFHNPADPNKGSHVVIFGGWVDETRTHYIAYEQTQPNTRKLATPYGYWSNATKYVPYRFNGVTGGIVPEDPAGGAKPGTSTVFPGAGKFGPGADNEYVKQLGKMLIDRGGRRFYPKGAASKWTDADRLATQAFQQAQGWTGADADGLPGAQTWRLLVENQGDDIRPTEAGAPGPGGVRDYPGASVFRPGSSHAAIEALGRRLVSRGFGKHYTSRPGRRWSEADRRNVEAFQRAQGWRGAQADGYPDPETWRRLFA
ncbi:MULTISPECIES: peptidoglycan-binding protein [unclassified Streptomyces]|uniref:peptidoglycan-binding protein n=1 Tax=unclassified Streptomyces TaxID=2593676 RepID=UPI001BE4EBC1|nr:MULTISPECIES: peptidoglycan-binding protein [unclassified Streptomyces]MBT2402628.1 peptidoglycan-binding protein [Streptomyces sp. ISL-21]MBT2608021.1 peptidoglycan-binding protein [Streptomyces sp. ISL-87]